MDVVHGYNRVGDFFCQFGIGGKKFFINDGSAREVSGINPAPECEVNGSGCGGG